jgi:hypothetical protein
MSELIPGEFAIRTYDTNNYISWSTGSLTTSATTLGQTEKFKLTIYTPQYTLIQTLDGQYVTAAPQGGLILTQGTEETSLFTLIGPQFIQEGFPGAAAPGQLYGFNIRTRYGPFVSAVNGGGMTSNAFLTDITVAQDWEAFSIVKSGDLGSGYKYCIKPFGRGVWNQMSLAGESIFTLIKAQPPNSGGYVLQTAIGFNYISAVDGGGLVGETNFPPPLTTAWKPLNWEVFNIVDQGDGTYFIQTSSGFYLGFLINSENISTDIGTPDTPPPGWITKFEFVMARTPVHGDILLAIP